ncbi:uncharacterized protein LOC142985584 isoform X2 [Anticarsia gemmatalis]
MGNIKNAIIKSKSSNSAITSKSETRRSDKKTRSNAEIQPLTKKRGVYVEKKNTNMSLNNPGASVQKPIPRPGRKRFLASVLTILSKSTTGTQLTEANDPYFNKKAKIKRKKDFEDGYLGDLSTKRKPKFRSRVLNDNRNFELDHVVVLQSTKSINQTPSNYSENNSVKDPEMIKWSEFLPPLVKKDSNLTKVRSKEKRVTLVDEPQTLIANDSKKDDSKILNFFVDLLETTFNVYNVQTEAEKPLNFSEISSKNVLEIDEVVANKLDIKNNELKCTDGYDDDDPTNVYCITPNERDLWFDEKSFKKPPAPSTTMRRKKMKSESFEYKKKPIPPTRSFIYQTSANKKYFKKEQKKNLLNQLKEELRMDDIIFEEPRNFYQALKVMARNKRRSQKSIHFSSSKKPSDGDVFNCMYKRRRLLSASTKSSKKTKSDLNEIKNFSKSSAVSSTRKTISNTIESNYGVSNHSLQVFGFDYEEPKSYTFDPSPFMPKRRVIMSKSDLNDAETFFLSDTSLVDQVCMEQDILSVSHY